MLCREWSHRAALLVLLALGVLLGGYGWHRGLQGAYRPRLSGAVIPAEQSEEILSVYRGRYNDRLPIYASEVIILAATEVRIDYRVVYFPFGCVEGCYVSEDTGGGAFSIETPLH